MSTKITRHIEVALTEAPPPDYAPGDRVIYRGCSDQVWSVLAVDRGVQCWWTRAQRDGTNQCFPAGVFTKIFTPRVATTPRAPREKKPRKAPDRISELLAEATDLDQCWALVRVAQIDVEELRSKIGHLSNGLQKMGIGNALRRAESFNPNSVIWTKKGWQKA